MESQTPTSAAAPREQDGHAPDPANITILTHICWPESADFKNMPLARALAARGHRVTILTGFPNYPQGRVFEGYRMGWRFIERVHGVRIVRVPLFPDHSGSGLKRMANYLSFTASSLAIGVPSVGPTDVTFVYAPPMTLGLTARALKILRGSAVLLDVVDLWPDAVSGSGMTRSRFVAWATGLFARQAYRTADRMTVLTEGFRSRIIETGAARGPIQVRAPWASHPSLKDERRDQDFEGRFVPAGSFVVVHAGNLGPFQDIDTVLVAARLLRRDPHIRFVLVGGGRDAEEIERRIVREDLINVSLAGLYPADRIPGVLACASACLVSLKSDPYLDLNMPSKVAAYLAAGKPIVANARGEVANLVHSQGVGVAAQPGSPESLAAAIAELADSSESERVAMGQRARHLYETRFDQTSGVQFYVDVIESMSKIARRSRQL